MPATKRPSDLSPWQIALGVLGASAGLTFALYLVGVFVEVRRFDTLQLPGAQTIAPLSHDSLLAVGGRALLVPFLAAVCSFALFVLLVRLNARGVVAALLVITIAAVATAAAGFGTWEHVAFVAAIEAGAAFGWIRGRPTTASSTAKLGGVVALAVAGAAAAIVLVHVWRPPVDLEYATVELRPCGSTSGVYLALTTQDLYIAPATRRDGGYLTHRLVVVVPRTDVMRITLHRKAHVWDGGPIAGTAYAARACAGR